MKRNFLLKMLATSTLFFNIFCLAGFSLPVCAITQYGVVTSPSLNCVTKQSLTKGDSSGLLDILTTIEQNDQKVTLKFNEDATKKLPALEEDESYFAVLKSKEKGIIGQEFLSANPQDETKFFCKFDVPNDCLRVDVHIYKQKNTAPAFEIKEENFIGRTKILMTSDSVYSRQASKQIKLYNANGTQLMQGAFLNRLTPNFYSASGSNTSYFDKTKIGKIELPEGKKDLLTLDETVVPCSEFTQAATTGNNAASTGNYYNFYLPDGVDEFTFKIYDKKITENATDVVAQFKVKLVKGEN